MLLTRRTVLLTLVAVLSLAACRPNTSPTPAPPPTVTFPAPTASPTAAMPTSAPSPTPVRPPNFLIIISDDQRYDTMDYMPRTKARVFDQGVTFSRAYVTTPLCCPSRSSILTGMYAYTHGVHTNNDPLKEPTFIERFHKNGYYTGNVGKYLNSWDGSYRPEFDYWAVFAGHGAARRYFDPPLNINGAWRDHSGYITYLLRDYAIEFLRKAAQQDKPFALIFAPNAPHDPADPAPGDENLYENLAPYRPPSFNKVDVSARPPWLQDQPSWSDKDIQQIDISRRKHLQCLNALDQSVDSLLAALDEQNKAENTVVIYISDNAIFWGEHGLAGKVQLYEEAIHVPFAMRYPPLVPKPRQENHLVANIDIASTLYELAGMPIPPQVDGRSLVPLLKETGAWRQDLLLEAWATPPGYTDQEGVFVTSRAIHTEQYVYIDTEPDWPELYDLANDPYQLQNQVDNPAYATILADLKKRLEQARPAGPRRTWVAQCTTSGAVLDPKQVAWAVGQGNLRLAEFDCTQSWFYPTGNQSLGWVIISGDVPAWAKHQLEATGTFSEPERADPSLPFRIYQDNGHATWPQGGRVRVAPSAMALAEAAAKTLIDLPVSFEGGPSTSLGAGLTLLGYTLDQSTVKPGETVHLETTWRVDGVPNQLLSLMAHVLAPDGSGAAVGDGLGVPIESWQPGDVFVQRHTLTLPKDARPGVYWVQTGVNWLIGGQRWSAQDARATGDRALLVPIEVTR